MTDAPIREISLNLIAILVSLLAVVYWVKLYKQLYKQDEREIRGWRWLFVAVLGILLFNISGVYLLLNMSDLYIMFNVSKFFPNARNPTIYVDMGTLEIFNIIGRTLVGIALTIGAYLLYAPMRRVKGFQYRFVPVQVVTENPSTTELMYNLEPGVTYLVKEERPVAGVGGYVIREGQPLRSIEIFKDLVTHGFEGLYVSRTHPQKIRERYDLRKIPVVWLSQSKDYKGCIDPSDLVELSHTIKEFVKESKNSVVILDGIEYLITQNNYGEVLKFIQSLNDVMAMSNSRLIVPIDPSTIDEKQLHLLEREMTEITSVWKV